MGTEIAVQRAVSGRISGLCRAGRGIERGAKGEVAASNYQTIFEGLRAIVPLGSTFEVRLLGTRKGRVDAGYFDNWGDAASAIVSAEGWYVGMYLTVNPVNPDLMARSYNRITQYASVTTKDPDILRRKWLLIDVDPIRPSGISSTESERQAAIAQGRAISGVLSLCGWCSPMVNSSGNGCHVMYPVDDENTDEIRDLYHDFLKILRVQFATDTIDIDTTVSNAARIWRIPGTHVRKGDSTSQRPHRVAEILQPIAHLSRVSTAQIQTYVEKFRHLLANDTSHNGKSKFAGEYPADEAMVRKLNDEAKQENALKIWVPHFFPDAREYQKGFRVSSDSLGLDYEEDLAIHPPPLGIKYFGVADQGDGTEGRRTPVGLIAELCFGGNKKEAADKLSAVLRVPRNEFEASPPVIAYDPFGQPAQPADLLSGLNGQRPVFDLKPANAQILLKKVFARQQWIADGRLPVGSLLLASDPKVGKTWLAIQLGLAIAQGGEFMGWPVEQGEVLYLGLEDTERRMQARIRLLNTFKINIDGIENFHYITGGMTLNNRGRAVVENADEYRRAYGLIPRGIEGIEALRRYKDSHPNLKAIFVDTLVHLRDNNAMNGNRNAYNVDYDDLEPMRRLANDTETLILSLHHLRKNKTDVGPEDVASLVSGSMAMTGATDGYMVLTKRPATSAGRYKGKKLANLRIDGRDVSNETNLDIAFDPERGGWLPVAGSPEEEQILDIVKDKPQITQREIADLIGVSQPTVSRILTRMKYDYKIIEHKGSYRVPDPQEMARGRLI